MGSVAAEVVPSHDGLGLDQVNVHVVVHFVISILVHVVIARYHVEVGIFFLVVSVNVVSVAWMLWLSGYVVRRRTLKVSVG